MIGSRYLLEMIVSLKETVNLLPRLQWGVVTGVDPTVSVRLDGEDTPREGISRICPVQFGGRCLVVTWNRRSVILGMALTGIDTDDWALLPAPSGITSKAYCRRIGDKVELKGWFTHSSTFANNSFTTMATLPVGFRPAEDVALVGAAGVTSVTPNYGGAINVYVSASGVLSIENRFGTAAKWAHLDGCYFYI